MVHGRRLGLNWTQLSRQHRLILEHLSTQRQQFAPQSERERIFLNVGVHLRLTLGGQKNPFNRIGENTGRSYIGRAHHLVGCGKDWAFFHIDVACFKDGIRAEVGS
jgi:hypothetical protein